MARIINSIIVFFNRLLDKSQNYFNKSYSQEGEDLVLSNYFGGKTKGFYIDVGAHHPFRFSNTFYFYKIGWRGINIDATPGSMNLFKKYRSKDINIEVPISNDTKTISYFIFDEPALNSFSSKLSEERDINTKYKIIKTIKLKPKRLSEVLDENIPEKTEIDFMSVDVEGYEHKVILSNNWNKYKPMYLLIEFLETEFDDIIENKTYRFLKKISYSIIGITGRTVIFKKSI